jgi:Flp pilus assembly pilin Flp
MQDFMLHAFVSLQQTMYRLREERGQTSIEYLGILVVVVAVLGVIIAAAPGFGNKITSGINKLIDQVLGG